MSEMVGEERNGTSRRFAPTGVMGTCCGHLGDFHNHRGWLPSLDCDACSDGSNDDADFERRVHQFEPVPVPEDGTGGAE